MVFPTPPSGQMISPVLTQPTQTQLNPKMISPVLTQPTRMISPVVTQPGQTQSPRMISPVVTYPTQTSPNMISPVTTETSPKMISPVVTQCPAVPGDVLVNSAAGAPTIFEYISQHPDLSAFTALIRTAGLETQFGQPGRYTLFTPTNEAVTKFLTRLGVTKPTTQLANALIGAHLVNSPISYGTVACNGGEVAYTVAYQRLIMELLPLSSERRFVPVVETSTRQGRKEARVVGTDLLCSNGFIQVVNEVLF